MSIGERWIGKCHDAEDGSGDLIIDLPEKLLARMGLLPGDELTLKHIDDEVVMTALRPGNSQKECPP